MIWGRKRKIVEREKRENKEIIRKRHDIVKQRAERRGKREQRKTIYIYIKYRI